MEEIVRMAKGFMAWADAAVKHHHKASPDVQVWIEKEYLSYQRKLGEAIQEWENLQKQ